MDVEAVAGEPLEAFHHAPPSVLAALDFVQRRAVMVDRDAHDQTLPQTYVGLQPTSGAFRAANAAASAAKTGSADYRVSATINSTNNRIYFLVNNNNKSDYFSVEKR